MQQNTTIAGDLSIEDLQEKLLQFEQMNSFVTKAPAQNTELQVKSENFECYFQDHD